MSKNQEITGALKEIVLRGIGTSQEGICQQLQKMGYDVNQTKISRLLRKIGAVRIQNEAGGSVYRLPKEPPPPSSSSHLTNLILDIVANEMVIVVTTSPGSASLMARVLDYNKEKCHILGTVAGDDTILIIPRSIKAIKKSLTEVRKLLEQY